MNTPTVTPQITLSIVSHGQLALVKNLLDDIQSYCAPNVEVILTFNIKETVNVDFTQYTFPLRFIHNPTPKGFAANQNAAFVLSTTPYYAVLNPDIRLLNNPFPELCEYFNKDIGLVAPLITDAAGKIQDTARRFPGFFTLLKRFITSQPAVEYPSLTTPYRPDWVGGMFMLFPRNVYQLLQGFDEKYYLYCEDLDLCARLRQHHYQVLLVPTVKVIHEAQRTSHHDLKYLRWHCQSIMRYLFRRYTGKFV